MSAASDVYKRQGLDSSKMKNLSDITISIPSQNTPRIQEAYMVIGHIICEEVEKQLFENL